MYLQILGCGTSTGVPLPGCRCSVCLSNNPKNKRTRSAAVIRLDDGQNILIDTTTDLRHQCLTHDIRNVNAVLYTHAHADHILGVDDLRAFNFTQKSSIPCYATPTTISDIKRAFWYIFDQQSDYEGGALTQISMHEIAPFNALNILDCPILPFQLLHGRMEVLGYRFGSVAYATDCNRIPDESLKILNGVEYLVLDGLRYEPHRTHFTIPEAIKAAQLIGAKTTYLTHMTHTIDYDLVSSQLPNGIELAYDGLKIEIKP